MDIGPQTEVNYNKDPENDSYSILRLTNDFLTLDNFLSNAFPEFEDSNIRDDVLGKIPILPCNAPGSYQPPNNVCSLESKINLGIDEDKISLEKSNIEILYIYNYFILIFTF